MRELLFEKQYQSFVEIINSYRAVEQAVRTAYDVCFSGQAGAESESYDTVVSKDDEDAERAKAELEKRLAQFRKFTNVVTLLYPDRLKSKVEHMDDAAEETVELFRC